MSEEGKAEMEKVKPYSSGDLFTIGNLGLKIDPMRVLATYAYQKNWRKGIDEKTKGCTWIWNGPVICAFELASWVKLEGK